MKSLFTSFLLFLILFSNKVFSECFPQPTVYINSYVNWNSSTSIFSDVVIQSGGTLDITSGSTIHILQGCKITVENGGYLIVNNATLTYECQGMWRGIYEESGGRVTMIDAFVTNAEYALELEPYCDVDIATTTFDKNYFGIYTAPSSGTTAFWSFLLDDVYFTCSGSLITNSVGPATKTMAGILFNNTSTLIEGTNNKLNFVGLTNGIVLNNCNVTVQNSYFERIRPDLTIWNPYDGSGIYALGTAASNLVEVGLGQHNPSTFKDCKYGIHTEGQDVSAVENYMEGVWWGIRGIKANSTTYSVKNNYIEASSYGIEFNLNNLVNYSIQNNEILMNHYTGIIGGVGIWVGESAMGGSISSRKFYNNTINLFQSKYGIFLSQCSEISTRFCNVIINIPFTNFGIATIGGKRNRYECNLVKALYADYDVNKCLWYTNASTENTILCNIAKNGSIGWKFDGQCSGTNFTGNSMNNNLYRSLWLGTNGVIGYQIDKGNMFIGANTTVECDPSLAFLSWFYVNPTLGPIYTPVLILPSGWFLPSSNSTLPDCSFTCQASDPPNEGDPIFTSSELVAASDNNLFPVYSDEGLLIAKADLLKKSISYHGNLTSDFQTFLIENLNSSLYNMLDKEATLSENIQVALEQFNQLSNDKNDLLSVLTQMKLNQEQIKSSTDITERNSLRTINNQLMSQLQNILSNNKTLVETVISQNDLILSQTQSNLNVLNFNSLVYENERVVTGIVYETLKDNWTLSTNDLLIIEEIANQCPLTGGNSVFTARNIMHMYSPDLDYSDAYICGLSNINYRTKAEIDVIGDKVDVFPNPSTEELTINYMFQEGEQISISCFNTMGSLVFTKDLIAPLENIKINVGFLSKGIYTLYINSSTGEFKNANFVKY